jgi:hypothetical protein
MNAIRHLGIRAVFIVFLTHTSFLAIALGLNKLGFHRLAATQPAFG